MSGETEELSVLFAANLDQLMAVPNKINGIFDAIESAADRFSSGMTAGAEKAAQGFTALSSKLEKLGQEENSAASHSSKLEQASDKAASSANTLANKVDKAAGSIASLTLHIKSGASGLLDFGQKLGLTVIGLEGLAQGAVGLATAFLAPNATLGQMRVSFAAFIPNAEQLTKTLAGLRQFAATTPFETADVNQASLSLLNMDVQAKDLTTWLNNLGAAVSKIGGSGQTFSDVTAIIAQMGVKGKVTTEEMQQLTERNIPAFKLLANSMGIPIATLQDMISNSELGRDKIDLLVQSMGEFGGNAMTAQGQTFNGLLSTLHDNADLALSSFSGPLFEMAKVGLTDLGNVVSSPAFQQFATDTGKKIGDVFQTIGTFVSKDVVPVIHDVEQRFQSPAFKEFANVAGKDIASIFQTIGDIGQNVVEPAVKGVLDTISSPQFAVFARDVGKLASQFSGGLQPVLVGAKPIIEGLFHFIQNPGLPVLSGLVEGISKVVRAIKDVTDFFSKNQVAADLLIGVLAGVAVGFVAMQVVAIAPLIPMLFGLSLMLLSGVIPALGAMAVATWAAIVPFLPFIAIGLGVAAAIFGIILVIQHWGEVSGAVGAFLHTVFSAVFGFFQEKAKESAAVFQGVVALFQLGGEAVGMVFQGMGNIIAFVWNGIVGVVRGGINMMIGNINSFIGFIDGIQIHIPSIGVGPVRTPAFDWNGVGIPMIPYLEEGGVVEPGKLAIAGETGEPEFVYGGTSGATVMGVKQTAALMSQGGGTNVTHVHVHIGEQEIATFLVDPLMEKVVKRIRLMGGRMVAA